MSGADFTLQAGSPNSHAADLVWGYSGRPLLIVLEMITLFPLVEELWDVEPGLIAPFYAEDAALDKSSIWSA